MSHSLALMWVSSVGFWQRGEEMSLLSSLLGGGGDSHSNFGAVLVCCCITCILRLPCWVNRALQWGHSYGFSPVWLNLWRFKWNESANAFPQISHENGRSPVWDLNIIFRTNKTYICSTLEKRVPTVIVMNRPPDIKIHTVTNDEVIIG